MEQPRLKRARASSLNSVRPLKDLDEDRDERDEDRPEQPQHHAHAGRQDAQHRNGTGQQAGLKRLKRVVETAVPPPPMLGSCSSDGTASITSSAASVMSDAEEYCFICMNGFSAKRPRMPIPCANKCNQHPVHAKCIYEWRECKSGREHSSCPLCRGRLGEIAYVPRDRIGSHRFRHSLEARRDFITSPVPQRAGVVRCYVRAFCAQGAPSRYELFLQAPTTLRYPLGPLPSLDEPKYGDQLLAISHKRPDAVHFDEYGAPCAKAAHELSAQLDVSMDASVPPGAPIDRASRAYLGHVASSLRGLEHTIYGTDDLMEIGAVRYTQNRVGPAVGPRRIHVCFPSLERVSRDARAHASRTRSNQDADAAASSALDAVVPDPERTLPSRKSSASYADANADAGLAPQDLQDDHIISDHEQHSDDDGEMEEDEEICIDAVDDLQPQDGPAAADQDRHDALDVDAVVAGDDQGHLLDPVVPPRRPARSSFGWNTRSHLPAHDGERLGTSLRRAAAEDTMSPAYHQQQFIFGANKTPYWLPTISAFSLDFCGRVTLPSNKNFQLMVNGSPNVALQFGKVAENREAELFTLDVSWPLSPLQAFGVALSACDRKLLCSSI